MSKQRYFKTVVRYEILSVDEPWSGSLESLASDVTDGHFSGSFLETTHSELTESEMKDALSEQGSCRDFFAIED